LLLQELARAARKFAGDTRCLREALPVTLVAGQPNYPLTPSNGQEEVYDVKAVMIDGEPLDPGSPESIPNCSSCWPEYFWWDPQNGLWLAETTQSSTTSSCGITWASIVRAPLASCTSVESSLLNNNGDDIIIAGALSRLLKMKANWRDLPMAEDKLGEFEDGVAERKLLADKQYRTHGFTVKAYP
jgi:hypothetical protein